MYIQKSFLNPMVVFSYLLMLVVGMILPSDGNHSLLAPKTLAFLNAAFWFTLYFISHWKLSYTQAVITLFVFLSLTFFGVWYVIGINQNPLISSGQYDQFKVFMITLFVPCTALYLLQEKLITPQRILRTLIYANAFYCTIKVVLMVLHVMGLVNAWTIMHETGFRYMSMHIIGDIGRIQTSVDIATPFLVFFALQSDNLQLGFSKKFKAFYFIIAALSTFLSFSRVLIFGYGLSVILHGMTLRLASQIRFWTAFVLLSVVGIAAVGPDKAATVVEKRLFSHDNTQSDATRRMQIEALMNGCDENPIIGKGLGGYTLECIRDYTLPHAYEVQWMAFLMQFGILGLTIILAPLGYLTWRLIEPPLSRPKLCYFLLLGLWLVSGFTNPFLISLTSGIIYMMFLLAGEISNQHKLQVSR